MRLLDTRTGEFFWVDDPRTVRYAILSHVWSTTQGGIEQTYDDVRHIHEQCSKADPDEHAIRKKLSPKIRRFCETALNDGFELGWADSCCIDKSSSTELSESISSMHSWYRYAGVCYAFLQDVDKSAGDHDLEHWEQFRSSKWFTRGWTLQELLAPSVVLFLSNSWDVIGSKHTLASIVSEVTRIDRAVLTFERPLDKVSVARRMSWAAARKTTREEDRAYSLMGIFGVNITVSYGEGRYSFIRLQEEILKHIPDQTIFAWGSFLTSHRFSFTRIEDRPDGPSDPSDSSISITSPEKQYLLASSPKDFEQSSELNSLSREVFAERVGMSPDEGYRVFTTTAYGIHEHFPLIAVSPQGPQTILPTHLALLACQDRRGNVLALLLRPSTRNVSKEFYVGTPVGSVNDYVSAKLDYSRAVFLPMEEVARIRYLLRPEKVYIPHRPSYNAYELLRDAPFHAVLRDSRDSFEVRLSGWSRKILEAHGYRITMPKDNESISPPSLHLDRSVRAQVVIIAGGPGDEYITIQVGRCNCEHGNEKSSLGVMVLSRHGTCPLEKEFDRRHPTDYAGHISSWAFRGGFASKEIPFTPHEGHPDPIVMRLTFSRDSIDPRKKSVAKPIYQLGVEIWTQSHGTSQGEVASTGADSRIGTPIHTEHLPGQRPFVSTPPSTMTNGHPVPFYAGLQPGQLPSAAAPASTRSAVPSHDVRQQHYEQAPQRSYAPPLSVPPASSQHSHLSGPYGQGGAQTPVGQYGLPQTTSTAASGGSSVPYPRGAISSTPTHSPHTSTSHIPQTVERAYSEDSMHPVLRPGLVARSVSDSASMYSSTTTQGLPQHTSVDGHLSSYPPGNAPYVPTTHNPAMHSYNPQGLPPHPTTDLQPLQYGHSSSQPPGPGHSSVSVQGVIPRTEHAQGWSGGASHASSLPQAYRPAETGSLAPPQSQFIDQTPRSNPPQPIRSDTVDFAQQSVQFNLQMPQRPTMMLLTQDHAQQHSNTVEHEYHMTSAPVPQAPPRDTTGYMQALQEARNTTPSVPNQYDVPPPPLPPAPPPISGFDPAIPPGHSQNAAYSTAANNPQQSYTVPPSGPSQTYESPPSSDTQPSFRDAPSQSNQQQPYASQATYLQPQYAGGNNAQPPPYRDAPPPPPASQPQYSQQNVPQPAPYPPLPETPRQQQAFLADVPPESQGTNHASP
ncbi:hypothetical protein BD309DRAFT_778214 [Dichomitus squalens]|nr:hypothetical protein BD309DRAFT_778214 [Dichomitus squalens]